MRRATVALRLLTDGMRVAARRRRRGPAHPGWSFTTELAATSTRSLMERSRGRPIGWLRARATLPAPRSVAQRVSIEPVDAGGVPGFWFTPRSGGVPERVVYYLHGGGYVFLGATTSHRYLISKLALEAKARVLAIDYRLAPEHRFPAALEDCVTAWRWLVASGVDPSGVAIAGDSAGGALAVATLTTLRDEGGALPATAALISPWVEPLAAGGSVAGNGASDALVPELIVEWGREYAGDRIEDPRVTVLHADLRGLPSMLVQTCSGEILVDQCKAFAERAREQGVDVTLSVIEGMYHDFQLVAYALSDGERAIREVATYLADRCASAPSAH